MAYQRKENRIGSGKKYNGDGHKNRKDGREIINKDRKFSAKNPKNVSGKKYAKTDSTNENGRTGRKENSEKSFQDKSVRVRAPKKKTIGCPIYEKCGGCLGQEEPYETTLETKQKELQSLLGGYCKLNPIIGMEHPYHYRNKVHAVFAHDKKGPYCGVYEEGTHRVIPVEKCWIENEKATQIILTIRDLLTSFKIKTYDEDKGYGLLRHVLVRTGYKTGEIMVVLVLSSNILPSKNNFVKALRKIHPEITTILINENYKNTSMILGDKEQTIYGKGFIYDELCGKTFRISAKSFYQVNPVQTEILYQKAIDFADLTGMDTVLDAYCGIGTIGMIASDHVKKVISVELNADAVRDAVSNARKNNIKNIDFYKKDASEFMTEMAGEEVTSPNVVFVDPPRAGCSREFLDSLCELSPDKIVYVSCNPETLERDLHYLTTKDYSVTKIQPVDMFPHTNHIECVVLLTNV